MDSISLSHFNLRSSVLCPENRHITSQYLVLEQLSAHHQMVTHAKGVVDLSAPKSLQSYISSMDRKKKSMWQQKQRNTSPLLMTAGGASEFSDMDFSPKEAENLLNKSIQAGVPYPTFSCKIADKISWYLEAISQGEFMAMEQPKQSMLEGLPSNHFSRQVSLSSSLRSKKVKGDLIDWHKNCFTEQSQHFAPRILANNKAKSKIREMKCYKPPHAMKKSTSPNSSMFESYDGEETAEELDDDIEEEIDFQRANEMSASSNVNNQEWLDEPALRAHVRNNLRREAKHNLNPVATPEDATYNSSNVTTGPLHVFSRDDKEKYLKCLVDVTEDILKSGIFTDRAIQRTFEFHLQFYPKNDDKVKLRQLLDQVLEGLKLSSTDESLKMRSGPINLTKDGNSFSSTPPEKESIDMVISELDRLRFLNSDPLQIINPNDSINIPTESNSMGQWQ